MTSNAGGVYPHSLSGVLRRVLLICIGLLFLSTTAFANGPTDKPIYLYGSPLTVEYLKARGTSNNTALTLWRKYLRKACRCYAEITRAELLGKLKPGLLFG